MDESLRTTTGKNKPKIPTPDITYYRFFIHTAEQFHLAFLVAISFSIVIRRDTGIAGYKKISQ